MRWQTELQLPCSCPGRYSVVRFPDISAFGRWGRGGSLTIEQTAEEAEPPQELCNDFAASGCYRIRIEMF
jgi:hypothetical protein